MKTETPVAPRCPKFLTPTEWRATLSDFFQHAMDTWVSILEYARFQNWEQSAFYAHRLKGCSALMGFQELSHIAGAAERALRSQPEAAENILDLLQQALVKASCAVSPT